VVRGGYLNPDPTHEYWWEYWQIKNITGGDREVTIARIKNPHTSGLKSEFALQYRTENGQIMSVVKADYEMSLEKLPPGIAWYQLDDHPLREQIYRQPSDFYVDIESGQIRRR
jgi:hypothetical protein